MLTLVVNSCLSPTRGTIPTTAHLFHRWSGPLHGLPQISTTWAAVLTALGQGHVPEGVRRGTRWTWLLVDSGRHLHADDGRQEGVQAKVHVLADWETGSAGDFIALHTTVERALGILSVLSCMVGDVRRVVAWACSRTPGALTTARATASAMRAKRAARTARRVKGGAGAGAARALRPKVRRYYFSHTRMAPTPDPAEPQVRRSPHRVRVRKNWSRHYHQQRNRHRP